MTPGAVGVTLLLVNNVQVLIAVKSILELGLEGLWLGQRTDNVLHVMGLAADEAAEVQDHALGLISLPCHVDIGVLKSGQLLLVALTLALKFLSNFLLKDKSLQCIVTLLLGSSKTVGKTSGVISLLLDESRESAVLALVILNLNLEVLSLLSKLLGKRLELEKLYDR